MEAGGIYVAEKRTLPRAYFDGGNEEPQKPESAD